MNTSRLAVCVTLLLAIACARNAVAEASPLPTTQPTGKHPRVPDGIDFMPDVVYATVDGESLCIDISAPCQLDHPLPCLIVIHGGGWHSGSRFQLDDATFKFASHGYIAATVEYRMAPAHRFPAAVQDVKAAVRFLRGNAEKLHIDPDHFGAVGFSAGAHLAMMLGTMEKADGLDDIGDFKDQSSKVQAVVSFFGPTDLQPGSFPKASANIVQQFLGEDGADVTDISKKASPITYVSPTSAPMLLFQGTADPLVSYSQAEEMAAAMQKAHVPGRVELIIGAGHGWGEPEFSRTAAASLKFFDQYLKGKTK